MQDQLVCHGCRNTLMYPRGATNVCCSLCNTINVPPPPHVMDMAHIVCGGCRTMLMYTRGATSVRCACCQTLNLVPEHCSIEMSNGRVPIPTSRPNGAACPVTMPSTSTSTPPSQTQTVVVENPMSVDESGKLVSNVVVGVTTDKK
ncbi:unnamed protein product [Arabis nemorensis]|uniref:Zinc finger LSD1-type domain-containing protein n=1 Tax=Arabis nemorensis TaxID=586526 RepID=A0A565CFJ5_9BRAS|nr:unnamed protein product [Arabis nemorensis]